MQVAALQPKLQALEAQWTQLQIPSGAATAEELIAYWNGAFSLTRLYVIVRNTVWLHGCDRHTL